MNCSLDALICLGCNLDGQAFPALRHDRPKPCIILSKNVRMVSMYWVREHGITSRPMVSQLSHIYFPPGFNLDGKCFLLGDICSWFSGTSNLYTCSRYVAGVLTVLRSIKPQPLHNVPRHFRLRLPGHMLCSLN